MDEAELKQRTKRFGLRCLKLADSLPRTRSGHTIAHQLARSGTAVGANYRAACRARSRKEFVSKLGIVEEEADESGFWIELIVDSRTKPQRLVQGLLTEAEELTRIMAALDQNGSKPSVIQNRKSKVKNLSRCRS